MSHTFRACWSSYVVLTICIGLLPAITLPAAVHGDRDAAWIASAGVAALLFAYFWLSRFRLTVTPQEIIYHSLFTGERVIRLSEITASEIYWERGYGHRALLQQKSGGVTTRINLKVFSREVAAALFHLVEPNQSLEPTAGRRDAHI
jgi:hypothetical protein